jgi:phenylalanyl-tRNA synthetase beta chain
LKISLSWLKDYVDLDGINVKDIIEKLTMSGLEVEDYVNQLEIYKDFIVGEVTSKEKHPKADKLYVCKVNTGTEELQVVCGAPNVNKGQKVIFAPVGTIIPVNGMKLTKAKIRGTTSFGMICSEAELKLGNDESGILVLDKNLKTGTPLTEALELDDIIFEIAVTPNRPDALSHIGVARDLSAIFGLDLKLPNTNLAESEKASKDYASVEIMDAENCPRYSARIVKNIQIRESPEWLKNRISKVGLRPINNIVDITNYIMYECGQPLHAFELERLAGKKIIVKSTNKESEFTTLDSKVRKLPAGTLMICDAEKEVAIAGVMGGENSEVSNRTKNILLESAHFNPSSIRKTSRELGLTTDASYRFERTVDPNNTDFAVNRAAKLIAEISGGEVLKSLIDVYPYKITRKEVSLRFSRLKKLLGYEIPKNKIYSILERLGLTVSNESEGKLRILVPTYRPDILREVDVIEEIARIYGYNNIPAVSKVSITLGEKYDESEFTDSIRNILTSLGLFEILNNPLQDEKSAKLTGKPVKLLNPLSLDMAYLRTSLIPGALRAIAHNIRNGQKNLAFFEIGNVFNLYTEESIKSFENFSEERRLLLILSGKEREKGWNTPQKEVDFFSLKGLVDSFLTKFPLDNVLNDSYYHSADTIYAYYFTKNLNNNVIGSGGIIKKDVLKQFDIGQDVFCFEFNLEYLRNVSGNGRYYSEPIKYPKVIRDFAFIFDKSITYEEVIRFIKKKGSELLKEVKLFDLFEQESIGKNKKSMAFTLEYQSENRTLTEEEVEKEFSSLISSIEKKFDAKLRGV